MVAKLHYGCSGGRLQAFRQRLVETFCPLDLWRVPKVEKRRPFRVRNLRGGHLAEHWYG
jgi:hypothetical protein